VRAVIARRWFVPLVLLAGCGGSAAPEPVTRAPRPPVVEAASEIETLDAGGPAVLALPKSKTRRVVIYMHGAAADGNALFSTDLRDETAAGLLRAGYAVAGADAGGNAWGAPESRSDYRELARTLSARGLTERYLLAESMGALSGFPLVTSLKARAVVAVYPVCDARTVRKVFAESIDAAYKNEPIASVQPVHFRRGSARLLFLASPGDTLVPKATNTDVCAADARSRGLKVSTIETSGDHADASNWKPEPIVRFFGGG